MCTGDKSQLVELIIFSFLLLLMFIAYVRDQRKGYMRSEKSKATNIVTLLTFLMITAISAQPFHWAKLPLALFFPGFLFALTVASIVLAVQALSWSLDATWNWRDTGLRQTFFLVLPSVFGVLSYLEIRELAVFGAWNVPLYVFAALEAALLAPIFTRYLAIRYTTPATAD